MATSRLGILQLLFGLMAVLLGLFLPQEVLLAFAAFLVLTIGLLHGSYDLGIMRSVEIFTKKFNFYHILIFYTIGILATIVFYFYFPAVVLFIFVLVSAYHFGEQHWILRSKKENLRIKILWFFYGAFILSSLFYFNREETTSLIEDISTRNLPEGSLKIAWIVSLSGFVLSGLLAAASLSRKRILSELLHLALILGIFYHFGVLYAFAIYFVIWHSAPSIYAQIVKVNGRFNGHLLWKYVRASLPIYLISVLFIAGFLWYFASRFDEIESFVLSPFIALTMAHSILFAIFLSKKDPNLLTM